MKNKKYFGSKKIILGSVLLLVFGIVAYFILTNHTLINKYDTENNKNTTIGIHGSPPTPEEQKAGDQQKQKIIEQEEKAQNTEKTASGKNKVTPIITRATSNSISAYIPSIFEDGGTCTAIFNQGSNTLSKQSSGFENASYTQCAPINVLASDYPSKGIWIISVKYSSASSEGISIGQEIRVE